MEDRLLNTLNRMAEIMRPPSDEVKKMVSRPYIIDGRRYSESVFSVPIIGRDARVTYTLCPCHAVDLPKMGSIRG